MIPIFDDGELVGFAGASAHVLDIGGAYPGLAIDLVDNWSEGNIYRAVKLQEKGVCQERALAPHPRERPHTDLQQRRHPGDDRRLRAGQAPLRRAARPLRPDTVLGAARGWLDYSERMLRQEIAKVPDGGYETEVGYLDDDGVNRGMKLPVKVAVEIKGDEITYRPDRARATRCRPATTARSRARPSRR